MTTEFDTPPHVTVEDVAPEDYHSRSMTVDFLYLDLERCERCQATEEALHDALDAIADLLDRLRVRVALRKIEVSSERDARRTGFRVSPTIRIDGTTVQPEYETSSCGTCSDLARTPDGDAGDAIDCRAWTYRGRVSDTPPDALLIEALLRGALQDRSGTADAGAHRLPENLREFFEAGTSDGTESEDRDVEDSGGPCC